MVAALFFFLLARAVLTLALFEVQALLALALRLLSLLVLLLLAERACAALSVCASCPAASGLLGPVVEVRPNVLTLAALDFA